MSLGKAGVIQTPSSVLYALIALHQGLLDDEGQIPLGLGIVHLAQVHEHGDEGGLSVGGHEGDHLVLDGLHAPADLLPQALLHDAGEHLLRGVPPTAAISASTCPRIFSRETWTKGARWAREMD